MSKSRGRAVSPRRVRQQLLFLDDPILRLYFSYVSGSRFVEKWLVNDGDRVLDVGTGAKRYPNLLDDGKREFIGLDISEFACRTANDTNTSSRFQFIIGDGGTLPLAAGTVDAVIAVGTFNRIANLHPFLREFERVLKPGGTVIFNLNNYSTIIPHKRQAFQSHFTLSDVADLLEWSSIELIETRYTFFTSVLQKKYIFSQRMPQLLRWVGLVITVGFSLLVERMPYIRSRGGHIWVRGRSRPPPLGHQKE
jgi:ubiquinone/menaquinone biosynthesis C-methylase UbiE